MPVINTGKSETVSYRTVEKPTTAEKKVFKFTSVVKRPFSEGFKGRKFYAGVLDDNNGNGF